MYFQQAYLSSKIRKQDALMSGFKNLSKSIFLPIKTQVLIMFGQYSNRNISVILIFLKVSIIKIIFSIVFRDFAFALFDSALSKKLFSLYGARFYAQFCMLLCTCVLRMNSGGMNAALIHLVLLLNFCQSLSHGKILLPIIASNNNRLLYP